MLWHHSPTELGELGSKLSSMTRLEVLYAGIGHILALPQQSAGEGGVCLYSGPEGVCCAAAPFIKEYNPNMEENDYESMLEEFEQPERNRVSINLLQDIHDNSSIWNLDTLDEKVEFINGYLKSYKIIIALA